MKIYLSNPSTAPDRAPASGLCNLVITCEQASYCPVAGLLKVRTKVDEHDLRIYCDTAVLFGDLYWENVQYDGELSNSLAVPTADRSFQTLFTRDTKQPGSRLLRSLLVGCPAGSEADAILLARFAGLKAAEESKILQSWAPGKHETLLAEVERRMKSAFTLQKEL